MSKRNCILKKTRFECVLYSAVAPKIGYNGYEEFVNGKNNIKYKNLNNIFTNIADIRLIPLDHVTNVFGLDSGGRSLCKAAISLAFD